MSPAPRAYVPMVGWKLTRWLLFYLAMLLADAAVIVAAGSRRGSEGTVN